MATTTTTVLPPIWTRVVFQNNTSSEAKLLHPFDPDQSWDDGVPKQIEAYRTVQFKRASSRASSDSITYFVYQLENGPKWIVAWKLQPEGNNKVYTRIMDQGQSQNTTIDWDVDIFPNINSNASEDTNAGYKAIAVIDKTAYPPTVTAIIGLPLHHCFA